MHSSSTLPPPPSASPVHAPSKHPLPSPQYIRSPDRTYTASPTAKTPGELYPLQPNSFADKEDADAAAAFAHANVWEHLWRKQTLLQQQLARKEALHNLRLESDTVRPTDDPGMCPHFSIPDTLVIPPTPWRMGNNSRSVRRPGGSFLHPPKGHSDTQEEVPQVKPVRILASRHIRVFSVVHRPSNSAQAQSVKNQSSNFLDRDLTMGAAAGQF